MIDVSSIREVSIFLEWLLRLANVRDKIRSQYLGELLKPTFHAFQEVHEQYLSLFRLTEKALPFAGNAPGTWHYFDELGAPFTVNDSRPRVQAVRKHFLEQREKGEHLRDELRQRGDVLLACAPGIEEKRFLHSVTLYFLDDGPVDLSDEFVDGQVRLVMSEGGERALNTPSARLKLELMRTDDPVQLGMLIRNAHMNANDRYVTCCRLYRKAEVAALGF
ncbi:hypothetical protein [Corallococcus exiguus]|uniref:hypothetical protein n=1 Tax=Corallococcus exiguus TaxID=83462 RepID=UPI001560BE0C|nr:hypothetical protein [Corallococcus exiguus]NRD47440.1 hypothetical protein [Corallococcus exiguus]